MAVTYVVDASAAIKAFIREQDSAKAHALFASQTILLAPAHALGECGEILARKIASQELTIDQAMAALETLKKSIGYLALDGLVDDALRLAVDTGASVYDTLYVSAAQSLNCQLVTADERLIRRISATLGDRRIVHLAGFQA